MTPLIHDLTYSLTDGWGKLGHSFLDAVGYSKEPYQGHYDDYPILEYLRGPAGFDCFLRIDLGDDLSAILTLFVGDRKIRSEYQYVVGLSDGCYGTWVVCDSFPAAMDLYSKWSPIVSAVALEQILLELRPIAYGPKWGEAWQSHQKREMEEWEEELKATETRLSSERKKAHRKKSITAKV